MTKSPKINIEEFLSTHPPSFVADLVDAIFRGAMEVLQTFPAPDRKDWREIIVSHTSELMDTIDDLYLPDPPPKKDEKGSLRTQVMIAISAMSLSYILSRCTRMETIKKEKNPSIN